MAAFFFSASSSSVLGYRGVRVGLCLGGLGERKGGLAVMGWVVFCLSFFDWGGEVFDDDRDLGGMGVDGG